MDFVLFFLAGSLAKEENQIDVVIKIPTAVSENSTVTMICDYNLYGEPLYTVKWYRGYSEFYRVIPKEMPPKATFPPLDAKVDVSIKQRKVVTLCVLCT